MTPKAGGTQRLALGDRAEGRDLAEGEEVLGEVHADGRMLPPEDHPPIQMPVLSPAAQAAGFAWNEQRMPALTALADASGLPRYHMATLVQDLAGIADLQDVAEAITTLGNDARALIGAARLYRELCNLTPQGPWEQLLLRRGARWAQGRAEGKARAAQAAKADQTPDDFIVSYGGRP